MSYCSPLRGILPREVVSMISDYLRWTSLQQKILQLKMRSATARVMKGLYGKIWPLRFHGGDYTLTQEKFIEWRADPIRFHIANEGYATGWVEGSIRRAPISMALYQGLPLYRIPIEGVPEYLWSPLHEWSYSYYVYGPGVFRGLQRIFADYF